MIDSRTQGEVYEASKQKLSSDKKRQRKEGWRGGEF